MLTPKGGSGWGAGGGGGTHSPQDDRTHDTASSRTVSSTLPRYFGLAGFVGAVALKVADQTCYLARRLLTPGRPVLALTLSRQRPAG